MSTESAFVTQRPLKCLKKEPRALIPRAAIPNYNAVPLPTPRMTPEGR